MPQASCSSLKPMEMRLPAPFYARGEHFAIDLPGAHALFTTRRGGFSEGPYTSLNLGRLTDDRREAVQRNLAKLHDGVAGAPGPEPRPENDRARSARGGGRAGGPRHRAVHDLRRSVAVLLAPAGSRSHRTAGRPRMVELITGLRVDVVRENLERVRTQIA